jgi:hypothetical protein
LVAPSPAAVDLTRPARILVCAGLFFVALAPLVALTREPVAAQNAPTPKPSATPAPAGPCATPALTSLALRPGIGRAPATSGAVCVAPRGAVVLGVGYRNQTTVGLGRQHLEVYPEPVALVGVADRAELILAPSLIFSRRIGVSGILPPSVGQQDAGVGAQYLLTDRPTTQQALAVFATLPTGYPTGSSGFSAGVPTYSFTYTIAVNLSGNLGLSTSQGVLVASAANALNSVARFVAYQPTINLSYALAAPTTLLLEDQITAPTGPQGPTGNRALLALQQTLSPNVVLDGEYEINVLPPAGFAQHAIGAGVTVRL